MYYSMKRVIFGSKLGITTIFRLLSTEQHLSGRIQINHNLRQRPFQARDEIPGELVNFGGPSSDLISSSLSPTVRADSKHARSLESPIRIIWVA